MSGDIKTPVTVATDQKAAAHGQQTDAERRQAWLASLPKDPVTGRNEVEEYRLRYGAY